VKVVDLTQSMTNGMPVMDGIEPPAFRDLAEVAADGYAMSQYTFINHTGTHVDAPAHQIAGGATLDDIPLDRLVTEALTIDLSAHDPGPVGLAVLGRFLPEVRRNDIVLLRSGHAANCGTAGAIPTPRPRPRWSRRAFPALASTARPPTRWTAPNTSCTTSGCPAARSSWRISPPWTSCPPAAASSSRRSR
jgi:kynurenine formamidase